MGLMDKFANPELFETLNFGEKMAGSAITMLMGMGITFMILLLLWGFVALMGKFMGHGAKKEKAPAPAAAAPVAEAVSAPPPAPESDDEAIAAVIAAAVAAYQGSGGAGNLVVRKISRLSGETTPWISAGRDECIERRQ